MTEAAKNWVERYVTAWTTNEPADIRAVFTDDAVYRFQPGDPEPLEGIDAIVAGWLESRDEPGEWSFTYEVVGVDGDTVFVEGATEYPGRPKPFFYNLWVVRLAPDGRARDFTEWYMVPRP